MIKFECFQKRMPTFILFHFPKDQNNNIWLMENDYYLKKRYDFPV